MVANQRTLARAPDECPDEEVKVSARVSFLLLIVAVGLMGFTAGTGPWWLSVGFALCAIPSLRRLARDGVVAEWCRRYHRTPQDSQR